MATNDSRNGTGVIRSRVGDSKAPRGITESQEGAVSAPADHKGTLTVEYEGVNKSPGSRLIAFLKRLDLKVVFGIGIVHVLAVIALTEIVIESAKVITGLVLFQSGSVFLGTWLISESFQDLTFFTWPGFVAFVILYILTGGGITMGFHRLFTHYSFKTSKPVWYGLAVLGEAAWEGPLITWVATHRKHHQHSDTEHDPHSPNQGNSKLARFFWGIWAHTFWFMAKNEHSKELKEKYAPDLLADKGLVLIDKLFLLPQIVIFSALFGLGYWYGGLHYGRSFLVWGGIVRIWAIHHATWSVNSVTHLWGYVNFKNTGDHSKNNPVVGIIGLGEGWHNNHHGLPTSAAHGMRWFEFDFTFLVIRLLGHAGLVWDVKVPDKEMRGTRKIFVRNTGKRS